MMGMENIMNLNRQKENLGREGMNYGQEVEQSQKEVQGREEGWCQSSLTIVGGKSKNHDSQVRVFKLYKQWVGSVAHSHL